MAYKITRGVKHFFDNFLFVLLEKIEMRKAALISNILVAAPMRNNLPLQIFPFLVKKDSHIHLSDYRSGIKSLFRELRSSSSGTSFHF
jgi:hypothetical protein